MIYLLRMFVHVEKWSTKWPSPPIMLLILLFCLHCPFIYSTFDKFVFEQPFFYTWWTGHLLSSWSQAIITDIYAMLLAQAYMPGINKHMGVHRVVMQCGKSVHHLQGIMLWWMSNTVVSEDQQQTSYQSLVMGWWDILTVFHCNTWAWKVEWPWAFIKMMTENNKTPI